MKKDQRTPFKDKLQNTKELGQISIFLGISMIVVISFLAFIINVGLFVKAKINLQNSVDAGAFAGAAVQARQLSNVGYLNWELRNTFKEWMFKYYVLGQKGKSATDRANIRSNAFNPGNRMNFRLRPFFTQGNRDFDRNVFDKYNVPSICIHFGSGANICDVASIPGLPRFNTVGLPSISQQHEAFLNTLVATKANDCSARSNVNLGAALLWAYGTGSGSVFADVPEIASTRPGAWIESIELAIRIRNLESIINVPPTLQPICAQASGAPVPCAEINTIQRESTDIPLLERPIKAFDSAFRNLGGGDNKGGTGDAADNFIRSFRLTELAPTPFEAPEQSLSGFLIPQGSSALTKHYLDLQVYPINYVTFFTLFNTTTDKFKNTGTDSEADCAALKAALPVPGYVTGFTKNPQVMTYYAVKGEAEFVGLFFPFSKQEGINMKAYASAKPMGGRIGPKLFTIQGNSIIPRQESNNQYTKSYASALVTPPLGSGAVEQGFPLPTTQDFWATRTINQNIGGNPTVGGSIFFTVPNLIYHFNDPSDIQGTQFRNAQIQELRQATTFETAYAQTTETAGLYDSTQYQLFEANQDFGTSGTTLTAEAVLRSIYRARRPTAYEALNYLIPVLDVGNDNIANVDHNFYVRGNTRTDDATGTPFYSLFGPISGPSVPYTEIANITAALDAYIVANRPAIQTYLDSLREVADQIRVSSSTATEPTAFLEAANRIHQNPDILSSGAVPSDPECQNLPLNQKFGTFFLGSTPTCGITPLRIRVTQYFNERQAGDASFTNYFTGPYQDAVSDTESLISRANRGALMTGYLPGRRQGATADGVAQPPFADPKQERSRRSFYSTKFFALDKVTPGSTQNPYSEPSLYIEGSGGGNNFVAPNDFRGINLVNVLDTAQIEEFSPLDF